MRTTLRLNSAVLGASCAFLMIPPVNAEGDPPCEPQWAHVGSPGGLGWVSDLELWDADGDGPERPRIIAANSATPTGQYPRVKELVGIASWNGNNWEPVGYDGQKRWVDTLGQWDHDNDPVTPNALIAAGRFFGIQSTQVHRVRMWDGAQWTTLGGVFNSSISAIGAWDADGDGPLAPRLVVGGSFTAIDGVPANHLAEWDGASWVPIPNSSSWVHSVTSWDFDGEGPLPPRLIAGAQFEASGDLPFDGIRAWDGTQWEQIGNGLSGSVRVVQALDTDGPGPLGVELVAGGSFSASGAATCRRIARWTGTEWSEVGGGSAWSVNRIAGADLDGTGPAPYKLFCCFSDSALVRAWDGAAWTALPGGPGSLLDILGTDPDGDGPADAALIACGTFSHIDERVNPAGGMARWDGERWGAFGVGIDDSLSSRIEALTVWDPDGPGVLEPRILAGGSISWAGVFDLGGLAQWTGHQWESVGDGVNWDVVSTMALWPRRPALGEGQRVVIGGFFSMAGTTPANRIAAWDGSTFHALGEGLSNEPHAITTWDPDGDGPYSEYVVVNYGTTIKVWNGAVWTTFPKPTTSGSGYEIAAFDLDGSGPEPESLLVGGTNLGFGRRWNWATATWDSLASPGPGYPTFSVFKLLVADRDGDGALPSQMFAIASYPAPSSPTGRATAVLEWVDSAWRVASQDESTSMDITAAGFWDPDGGDPSNHRLVVVGRIRDHVAGKQGTVAELAGDRWRLLLEVPDPIGDATLLCVAPVNVDAAGFPGGTLLVGGYPYPLPAIDGSHVAALTPCPVVPAQCPGDITGDGDTNISDFNILAGNFGQTVTPNTGGDLTGDGVVNISDFNILAGDFGCAAN